MITSTMLIYAVKSSPSATPTAIPAPWGLYELLQLLRLRPPRQFFNNVAATAYRRPI